MWNAPPCWIYGKGSHSCSLHSGAPFISSRISSFQKMSLLMTLNLACLIGPVNYVIGAGTVFLLAPKAISALWHQGGQRGRKCRNCWNGLVVDRERSQWMLSLLCRMLTHKLKGTCLCSTLFSIRDWVVDKMGHARRMMHIIHVAQLGRMKCPWETVLGLCITHWASL